MSIKETIEWFTPNEKLPELDRFVLINNLWSARYRYTLKEISYHRRMVKRFICKKGDRKYWPEEVAFWAYLPKGPE